VIVFLLASYAAGTGVVKSRTETSALTAACAQVNTAILIPPSIGAPTNDIEAVKSLALLVASRLGTLITLEPMYRALHQINPINPTQADIDRLTATVDRVDALWADVNATNPPVDDQLFRRFDAAFADAPAPGVLLSDPTNLEALHLVPACVPLLDVFDQIRTSSVSATTTNP
jgi:hypothetical protein